MIKFCHRESSMRNVRLSKLDELVSNFKKEIINDEMTPQKK